MKRLDTVINFEKFQMRPIITHSTIFMMKKCGNADLKWLIDVRYTEI